MSALDDVLPLVRCSVCARAVVRHGHRLVCPRGHGFDVARQGYVNLAVGSQPGTGDEPTMIAARERFLAAGHYEPVATAIRDLAPLSPEARVLDLAGGTGWYLARLLGRAAACRGVVVDLSTAALRRAARLDGRIAAIGADAWSTLPFVDAAFDAVLSVFGPRSAAEIRRVVRVGGRLVTVTPEPDHLLELREPLGLLDVPAAKTDRLAQDYGPALAARAVRRRMELDRMAARDLAAMGPAARHTDAAVLDERVRRLPEPVAVTLAVTVSVFEPHRAGANPGRST